MSGSWITPANAMQFDDPTTAAQYYAQQGTTSQGAVQAYGDAQNPILGAIRGAIAPTPGRVYGDMAPISSPASYTTNPPQGLQYLLGLRPAIPNAVRDMVNGGLDLLESPSTGTITPRASSALLGSAAPELGSDPVPGVLKTFGGLGAKSANTELAHTAQHLLNAGADPEEVFAKTGWYKGKYDGKMKFEMDDSGAKLGPKFYNNVKATPTGTFEMNLGDMLHHPELYHNYPDIANIQVRVAPSGLHWPSNVHGALWPEYFDGVNTHPPKIDISGDQTPSDITETLLHEIQHVIQEKEGFEPGGNNTVAMQANKKLAQMSQLTPNPGDEQLPILQQTYRSLGNSTPYNLYQNIAGEVEAEDTGNRLYMLPEEKKVVSPNQTQNMMARKQIPLALINTLYAQYLK